MVDSECHRQHHRAEYKTEVEERTFKIVEVNVHRERTALLHMYALFRPN